jgi:hypothetical protein
MSAWEPVRSGVGVADHEVTPKAPWTASGWRGYSLRRVQGGHPPFHRHADCQHPILPTWDYQLGKSVTLLASDLLNL